MTYNEKLAKFKHQTLMFLKSPREAEDLFRFAVHVAAATAWGSGLLFDDLEEAIHESFYEVDEETKEAIKESAPDLDPPY